MVWLKEIIYKIWFWITYPFYWIREEIAFRKKMKELQERDPYIYD